MEYPFCETSTTTSTSTEDLQCNEDMSLYWRADNSNTITPGASLELNFEGGNTEFDITVSGDNFWTNPERTNTSKTINASPVAIYAGDDACGGARVTVKDNCNLTAEFGIKTPTAYAVQVSCANDDWHYRETVSKSKSHSANCNTSYCDDWAAQTGCIEGTLVCIAKTWMYDKCICDVYNCYKYVCP
ncbi:MAG: hypothetical protein U5R30_10595 [Deltaproteobacteria bacterium]|nr:hypothetical protein [Deltaproteobacteria bacterium]